MTPRAAALAIAACAALGGWVGSRAAAQAPPALAGVVVRFEGGEVARRCVDLGPGGEMTGLDALQATGLDLVYAAQANGALVCRIEDEGCDHPAEDCLCHCEHLDEGCRYWAYYSRTADGWRYENRGPQSRRLRHGDVDGWAWGPGTEGSGQRPPDASFEELCAERLASATPSPTASASPRPSATPRPTASPRPTATPRATATPRPGASPRPSASPTRSSLAGGSATAAAGPTGAPPYPGPDDGARATLAAYPTRLAELMATAGARVGAGDPTAGPAATEAPTATRQASTPTRAPSRAVTFPAPSPIPADAGRSTEGAQGRRGGEALLTAAILGLLGLAWWRSRGGRHDRSWRS